MRYKGKNENVIVKTENPLALKYIMWTYFSAKTKLNLNELDIFKVERSKSQFSEHT